MRRFPRPSHTEPLLDGCLSNAIVLVLMAACPPLGLIALLLCGFLEDNFRKEF